MHCLQKCGSPIKQNLVVERGLNLHLGAKRAKQCLKWGCLNIIILAILLFDISNKCPYAISKWYYVEYAAMGIVSLSTLTYFLKYCAYMIRTEPVHGTKDQKNLLKFEENDNSFIADSSTKKANEEDISPARNMNTTILSWHSSFNDSRAMTPPIWNYDRTTPPRMNKSPGKVCQNTSWNNSMTNNSSLNASTLSSNASSFVSPYTKYAKDELITDRKGLEDYLQEVSKQERIAAESHETTKTLNQGSINSFWNYCNNAASLLKTSIYQLAPSTTPSQNKQSTKEEGGFHYMDGNSDIIKKLSSEQLSQYVANLRRWISITILNRLDIEIKNVDQAFRNRGFSDIQIGSVGLDRLRKTADNQQFVSQFVPMLPLIVPFLEVSNNQEYLVHRIKELAKGTCIADYRWNSGSPYNGICWEDHLPTDAAIIFHLFCVYLDSQLMPLPQPGGRPFYNRYVILGDKKSAKETIADVNNKSHCAILCTNPLKPKFNFISDQEIHSCVYDRNNLFYVIIQFLIYMKANHECLLEGINLGKSGINIMCVIEE